jgi:hypothetical protein
VTFGFEILEGESKGEKLRQYDGMDSEERLAWLFRDIAKFGYEMPDDEDELDQILAEIQKEKPIVRLKVKTNGDFQNVNVDKVLSESEAEDMSEEGAEVSEDVDEDQEAAEDVVEEPATEEPAEEEEAEEEVEEEPEEQPKKKVVKKVSSLKKPLLKKKKK